MGIRELIAMMGSGSATPDIDIGDNVAYSLMLDSASSQYLSRTNTTSATFTYSVWVKRGKLGAIAPILDTNIKFNANDTLTAFGLTTTAVYRDPSAWYHIHVSNGGLYVNGVNMGAVTTSALTNPRIGFDGTNYFDGYMALSYLVDGTSDAYSNYGRTSANTGAWVNKNTSPTYGAKGHLLTFSNSGALGTDTSGNGNTWTTNGGISSANQYTDTPTNNYCTLLPLTQGTSGVLSKGNLMVVSGNRAGGSVLGTIYMPSGKWYWEVSPSIDVGGAYVIIAGIAPHDINIAADTRATSFCAYMALTWGAYYQNSVTPLFINAYKLLATDRLQFAYDADNHKVWVGINNTWYNSAGAGTGNPAAGTNATQVVDSSKVWSPVALTDGTGITANVNFGAKAFTYTPPTGFLALCTANLSASGTVTVSGTFTGNAATDGPFVFCNGYPTTLSIDGNAVTFGTHADRTANGFKLRTASSPYNQSGTRNWTATIVSDTANLFKYSTAKGNP